MPAIHRPPWSGTLAPGTLGLEHSQWCSVVFCLVRPYVLDSRQNSGGVGSLQAAGTRGRGRPTGVVRPEPTVRSGCSVQGTHLTPGTESSDRHEKAKIFQRCQRLATATNLGQSFV